MSGGDVVALDGSPNAFVPVAVDVGVLPGGTEDGSAPLQDSSHVVAVERPGSAVHQALPAVHDADHLCTVVFDGPTHDRTNDRVEARAVSARGEHAYDFAHQ